MEKQIETVHLLRNKYGYDDYIHLKVVPGASRDAIKTAMALANRVSINIEAATPSGLAELSSTKRAWNLCAFSSFKPPDIQNSS